MSLSTNNPYEHDIYTVKQLGAHTVKIAYCSTVRKPGWEVENPTYVPKGSINSEKLENNLSRAKNTVKEYALCNDWDFWCTFTIDPHKHDRYNLDGFMKHFAKFINNYNYRNCKGCPEYKVKYVLVPEQHKDSAWHVHGFIKGIKPSDLYTNKHGYLTWTQYEQNFGYISMEKVKDIDKASSYILKYMTKDTDKNVSDMHRHLYYASQGLSKASVLYKGHARFKGEWDWEHPDGFCKIKQFDSRENNIQDYMEIEKHGYNDGI